MPQFKEADEGLQVKFHDIWELHQDILKPSVFERLDDHVETVKGYNRGRMSTAYTQARKGPDHVPMRLRFQNSVSAATICHELGHALLDAHGIDDTQEATDRASNKKNHSRWPQFSFGKRDSPVERFLLRRYGDLPDLSRSSITADRISEFEKRSDVFYIDDWYEVYGYRLTDPDRHDTRRYQTPVISQMGEPKYLKVKSLKVGDVKNIYIDGGSTTFDDVELVDRYELTPGLDGILDQNPIDWSGLERLLYQINTHWHEAVTLVRKRGDAREKGQMKAPRGKESSYYVMNTHEYFAEIHSTMMMSERNDTDVYQHRISRLREYCPGLIEAYTDVLMK